MNPWITSAALLVLVASALQVVPSSADQPNAESVKVFLLAGQSNMEGQGVVDLDHEQYYNGGRGNLEHVMRDPANAARYAHLRDDDGAWVTRDDVFVWYKTQNAGLKKGRLSIGFTGYGGSHHIGPELQFGHVLGDALEEPVLLIKTAWGGKSVYQDFRPPSSSGQVGPYYTKMIEEIREALADAPNSFSQLQGRDLELAGLVWLQGWNDMCTPAALPEYEQNLVNLILDLRKEFDVPNLPVVIGELGNGGPDATGAMAEFRKAQAAAAVRAELGDAVLFVETTQFARPAELSPCVGHGHHWFANAESYFLLGDALGQGMKRLAP